MHSCKPWIANSFARIVCYVYVPNWSWATNVHRHCLGMHEPFGWWRDMICIDFNPNWVFFWSVHGQSSSSAANALCKNAGCAAMQYSIGLFSFFCHRHLSNNIIITNFCYFNTKRFIHVHHWTAELINCYWLKPYSFIHAVILYQWQNKESPIVFVTLASFIDTNNAFIY